MTTEIASLPIYLTSQESHLQTFSKFISAIERDGFYVKKIGDTLVHISQEENSEFNHIVINIPQKLSNELTACKFYILDGWRPSWLMSHSLGMFYGLSLKNPDRIIREPSCNRVFDKFISTFKVFRCPNCGSLTFKRENWEHKESRFSEERIENGLNAIATILFLGGHGAGGWWSQATKPRENKSGFTLSCTCCDYIKSVTTSIKYL